MKTLKSLFITPLFAITLSGAQANSWEDVVVESRPLSAEEVKQEWLNYQISNPKISTLNNDETSEASVDPLDAATKELDKVAIILDKFKVVGEKFYALLKAGEPVMNFKGGLWSVIPNEAKSVRELTGWNRPVMLGHEMIFRNGFGMKVMEVRYLVSALTGGSFNGKGSYLANVTVVPSHIVVQWGFRMDVDVVLADAFNMGTLEAPVTGLNFEVQVRPASVVTKILKSQIFTITGDGKLTSAR